MDNLLLYNMQLVMLKQLLGKDLLNKAEYDLIKNKLMKKYKIIEQFLVV
ncbi:SHOCT domain-containing protein [Alkaliphilus pronyensis]|nr:SHOCT domain-containing protein [Alkaliphilus pronyensis]